MKPGTALAYIATLIFLGFLVATGHTPTIEAVIVPTVSGVLIVVLLGFLFLS